MDTLHWILIALAASLYLGGVITIADEGSGLGQAFIKPLLALVVVLALPGILATMVVRTRWKRGISGPLVQAYPVFAQRIYLDSALFIGRNRAIAFISFDKAAKEAPNDHNP